MPNWVTCRVIAKDFEELKKHLVNEKGEVDFNVAIPMPQDLHITSGSYSYEMPSKWLKPSESQLKTLQKQKDCVDVLMLQVYNDTITQQEFFEEIMQREDILKAIRSVKDWYTRKTKTKQYPIGKAALAEGYETYIKGFFNVQRYGERDWYEWSIQNWSTKWNASNGYVDDSAKCITFETAWSMPENVLKEVCKYTPLRVLYADEDIGANCGMEDYFVDEEGFPVYEKVMEGSTELASEAWGYGHVDVYDEDGEWIEDEDNPKYKEANKNYFTVQEEINTLMNPACIEKDFAEV